MFTAKHNIQERKEDLENIKEIIVEFKERLSRKQEKLKKKQDFRKGMLLEKYIIKMLYKLDNRKFKEDYLKKLERNQ